jgi:hypothetical protein
VHPLTKIFIVLVALLAVAIVPLVAVNAANEGTFKRRWLDEQAKSAAATTELAAARANHQATEAALSKTISELQAEIARLTKEGDSRAAQLRKVEGELAAARALQATINSNLEIMAQTGKASTALNESLVRELRDLRAKVVESEKQVVELDEAVATLTSQLEVADAARRSLQEELIRISEEKAVAVASIAKYVAYFGELPAASAGATTILDGGRIPADRDLSATVVGVQRSGDSTLAEINAGSRDGVREGWVLMIGDSGRFVANLRIIEVDVNRATGVVELENRSGGSVAIGQRAVARRGE